MSYNDKILGTPRDYSDRRHSFYFELADPEGLPSVVLKEWLGPARFAQVVRQPHGFQIEMPIQEVPDVIRRLVTANVAIYQVARRTTNI